MPSIATLAMLPAGATPATAQLPHWCVSKHVHIRALESTRGSGQLLAKHGCIVLRGAAQGCGLDGALAGRHMARTSHSWLQVTILSRAKAVHVLFIRCPSRWHLQGEC